MRDAVAMSFLHQGPDYLIFGHTSQLQAIPRIVILSGPVVTLGVMCNHSEHPSLNICHRVVA